MILVFLRRALSFFLKRKGAKNRQRRFDYFSAIMYNLTIIGEYGEIMYRVIKSVEKGSVADKNGIRAGDELISINGEKVLDYIDYAFFMGEERLNLVMRTKDGKKKEVKIRKEDWEDLGLAFEEEQLGDPAHCRNKCIFCFVDQLPSGMRETLHVKDDDWRFSFLMGNYVTLTNLSEDDILRIIRRRVSPLYVSVHATEDELRRRMLGNPKAPEIMPLLRRFIQNGVEIHAQIVVCEGINDGEKLDRTIKDLFSLHPGVGSVAVVPVGLTRHREKLPVLKPISQENATRMINAIHALQIEFLRQSGTRFVFASDEMYIRAQRKLPEYGEYEDFMQIENGVGLISKFMDEVGQGIEDFKELKYGAVSVATGEDFAPFMKEIAKKLKFIYNININVYSVQNDFFGRNVTVTGLLTGRDIITQLKGKELGEKVFLCGSIFRQFEKVTLDNITLDEIAQNINTECEAVPCDGYEWISVLAKEK